MQESIQKGMQQDGQRQIDFGASKPDPRILIVQVAAAAVLASMFRNLSALLLLFLVLNTLLLLQTNWKTFWNNAAVYIGMLAILFALERIYIPVLSNILPMFLMLMVRMYPVYIAGRILLVKAPMDELLFALEKWHIPKLVLIPLSVIYRYIPTILKEIGYIRESLKMRNFEHSFRHKCRHPIECAENFLVPLLYRSEKICEELSAASISKGLSTRRKRTCCAEVKLRWSDMGYLLGMAVVSGLLIFVNNR